MTRLDDLTVFGLTVTVHAQPSEVLGHGAYLCVSQPHPALVIPDPEESEEAAALALFTFLDDRAGEIARDAPARTRLLFGLLRDNPAWAQRIMRAEAPEHVLVGVPDDGEAETTSVRGN